MDTNQPRPVTPQPPQGGGGGSSVSASLTVFLSFIAIFAMVRIIYQTISTLNTIYKYSTATAFVLGCTDAAPRPAHPRPTRRDAAGTPQNARPYRVGPRRATWQGPNRADAGRRG